MPNDSTDLIAQMYPDAPTEKPASSGSPVDSDRVNQLYGNSGSTPVKVAASSTPSSTDSRIEAMYGAETPAVQRPVTTPTVKQPDILEALYPSSKPAPAEPAAAEPAPVDEPVDEPVGETTETVEVAPVGNRYSTDPEGIENVLYGETERAHLTPESMDLSIIYSDPEDQAVLHDTLEVLAGVTGMQQDSVAALMETVNTELLNPEPQQTQQQTLSELYREHGSDLHQSLADAQALVQSFPDVSAWLESTGLGDSPAIINQIIRISKTPRSQARIQQLRDLT